MSHRTTYTRLERRYLRGQSAMEAPPGLSLDDSIAALLPGCLTTLRRTLPTRRIARNALTLEARRTLAKHGPGIHRRTDYTKWRFVIRLDGQLISVVLIGGTVAHCHWAEILTRATKEALAHFPAPPGIHDDTDRPEPVGRDSVDPEQAFKAWVDARVEELTATGAVPRPRPRAQVVWITSARRVAVIHLWLDLPEFTEAHADRIARVLGAVMSTAAPTSWPMSLPDSRS